MIDLLRVGGASMLGLTDELGSLAPGRYSLVITVEDLISGQSAEGRTDFVRLSR